MNESMKGFIFDLDGTLVDSMGVWSRIDFDFLAKRGIPLPEDLGLVIKNLNFNETAAYFISRFELQDAPEDIVREWQCMAQRAYAQDILLKPGVEEFLSKLKARNKKIGLATSASRQLLEAVLNNQGVYHYFDAVCTMDEVKRGKNFPDIYLLAAKKLGLAPEECAAFEDILPAVQGAKSAGMKVVGVYDLCSVCEQAEILQTADAYIQDFYDKALERFL